MIIKVKFQLTYQLLTAIAGIEFSMIKTLCKTPLLIMMTSLSINVAALNPVEVKDSATQQATTVEILKQLDYRHYNDVDFDDKLSSSFLDNYYSALDPNRVFFFQQDIDGFEQYRFKLDDMLKKGDNSAGFAIYQRYRQRLVERLEEVVALLSNKEFNFNFAVDEHLAINREDAPWLENKEQADDLWRKRIKSTILSQKLSGDTIEKVREQLTKRYQNQLNRVKKQNSGDVYEIFINALAELYDPHTNYLPPRQSKNFNIHMSLSLEGIGAVLQTEDEHTKVVRIVTAGPAAKQGQLKPADKITAVAQGDTGEMVDVVGWRLDEVVDLIRGPKGTVVRLQIIPSEGATGQTELVRIKRGKVKLEEQAAKKAVFNITENGRSFKIGVIDVPAFYLDFDAWRRRDPNFRSTTRDVLRLLGELNKDGVDGIVLDLRDNGGGSLQEATTLTDLFIDKGPVVQIRQGGRESSRSGGTRSYAPAVYRGPMLVLINRLSASASEIFAGAIQDYHRGLIVGSQSFGKGTVQSLAPINDRGQLKITESKFYRVSGDSTQHRGVIPDIKMPELIDTQEVGESSYDTALPWDQIRAVPHEKYFSFSTVMAQLQSRHQQRVNLNPDFVHMREQKSLLDKYDEREHLSLNEKKRLEEQRQLEVKSLQLENQRRTAKGLVPYKNVESLKTANEERREKQRANANVTTIEPDDDPILYEAGHVLKDFIQLFVEQKDNKVANF